MVEMPEDFSKALTTISSKLSGLKYAIRGTTSLVLQGLDMGLEDIDVICNSETALKTNDLLKEYLVRPVEYSESKKFKSYFGEFKIEGVRVEIMGDWQIFTTKGVWSDVHDGSGFLEVELEGHKIPVTPISEELKVFIEMGRWTAYHKIKAQLPSREVEKPKEPDPQLSLF